MKNNLTKNRIPVVVAFTPNYFIQACVGIKSVLIHSLDSDIFHIICLLSENLSEKMVSLLERLGKSHVQFSFINLEGKLADIYINERFTVAASYRLLLPDLLPEYDKVLYMDCDMIIRNNLAELYRSVDLKDNYLAAVYEAPMDFQTAHLKEIGCDPEHYINSGFLIMNLEQMRKDNMVQKFMEASKASNLEFPDQDVLNQTCKGKILGLPPYCNSIRTSFLPQYKKFFLQRYTQQDWEEIQKHGNIHYTGDKPWRFPTVEFAEWWKYYRQLPNEIRSEEEPDKKMLFLYRIYSNKLGRFAFKGLKYIYRKLKYSGKA